MNVRNPAVQFALLGVGVAAAAATWLGWDVSGHSGADSARAALAVLALATPIGMLLAIALPQWLTQRVGHRIGVTAIGSHAPERWQRVETLVIDPFRSLTTGDLVVIDVNPVDPDHEGNLRWFAGALAHSFDDPVGRAVAKLAGRGRVSNVTQEPGHGIRGSVDRHPVRVGNPQWLGVSDEELPAPIGTTVAVDVDQRALGRITVADEVRRDATHQLDLLRRTGLTPVLAAERTEAETERLARLSVSPAWHAETNPLQLARELTIGGKLVGLVHSEPDGTASLIVVDAPDHSPAPHPADAVVLTAPRIDTVVQALTLVHRSERAQRRATRLAGALLLLPLPFAALGLIAPVPALALAALTWIVVGIGAGSEFVGIHVSSEPDRG